MIPFRPHVPSWIPSPLTHTHSPAPTPTDSHLPPRSLTHPIFPHPPHVPSPNPTFPHPPPRSLTYPHGPSFTPTVPHLPHGPSFTPTVPHLAPRSLTHPHGSLTHPHGPKITAHLPGPQPHVKLLSSGQGLRSACPKCPHIFSSRSLVSSFCLADSELSGLAINLEAMFSSSFLPVYLTQSPRVTRHIPGGLRMHPPQPLGPMIIW